MAATTPPIYVDAPPAGPIRYGLFKAARMLDLDIHGRTGGLQFEPDTCGIARLYTAECPASEQDVKTLSDLSPIVTATPFVAYASVLCSPVGRTPEEQQRRAVRRLMAGEQTQVEHAFWNGGGVGASPALTLMGATIVASALTSFGGRLAALEEAFYDVYGYQGTVHVNTAAYGAAAFGNLIIRPDTPDIPAHLVTPIGSIWSFGPGYDITGPANVAPAAGSVWAFITGAVTVWRSQDMGTPDPRQTFDRTTNQMVALAEREYVVAPDCPEVFAIQLPLEAP